MDFNLTEEMKMLRDMAYKLLFKKYSRFPGSVTFRRSTRRRSGRRRLKTVLLPPGFRSSMAVREWDFSVTLSSRRNSPVWTWA